MMNRTMRAFLGAVFVLVITFSAISISQNIGKGLKVDVTDQHLYTLSDGSRAILSKLNQPITAKLYYSKTATIKGSDQIRYFNNYYEFVKSLLEEYVAASNGMVKLEIIDPRPYSEEETEAMRYGLTRYQLTEDETFFFGLVVQTEFGVDKVIKFFSPDRENFIEYDISSLIDSAITRQKRKVGVMSSLPVMGDSEYMARMMQMQNQNPKQAWTFIQQLRTKYEVTEVPTDANDINDVDILLIIHPKDLSERTLFAIDQFVLKGGRTIVCVDPYCFSDVPDSPMNRQMAMQMPRNSDLNVLMRTWGIEMPENTFAGDKEIMAQPGRITGNPRSDKLIGYLDLVSGDSVTDCFDKDSVITGQLNLVEVLYAGILKEVVEPNQQDNEAKIEKMPLIMTTDKGNSFSISSPYELMMPADLTKRFIPGDKPVVLGYMLKGHFKSSFPNGIEIEVMPKEPDDPNNPEKIKQQITGLTESAEEGLVIVYSDVDFISDLLAYESWFFGKRVYGDNSALMLNSIDVLTGSSDLVSIRSRGNFKKPFIVVDEIKKKAEAETAEEVARLNQEISNYANQLQLILSSAKEGQEEVVGSSIIQAQRDIELKKREAERQLVQVQRKRRERIEHLGNMLRNFNMLAAPIVILLIAVLLGIRRGLMKRHYISHTSDA